MPPLPSICSRRFLSAWVTSAHYNAFESDNKASQDMCMTSLDNTGDGRAASSKLLGKMVYLLCGGIVDIGSVGCHKPTAIPPPTESVTDSIRDADHLYSERGDLLKVRQAIVILRQAQGVDPSNYEIAWRLAEYNYDLGSSTTS